MYLALAVFPTNSLDQGTQEPGEAKMVKLTADTSNTDTSNWVEAPELAPAQPAIDRAHLARMTLGERDLEREVLTLFDRQAEILVARMRDAGPAAVAAFAH